MINQTPPIDSRTAEDIVDQIQTLLPQYLSTDDTAPSEDRSPLPLQGASIALVNIFARFAEIIIQRLNRVPDKSFLAFLDLLGASRLSPQPARAPLTFTLAAGSRVDAVVPAGTQVAAPPAEGERDPLIYETERELVVTPARLSAILVRDPEQDTFGDYTSLITPEADPVPVFRGNRHMDHHLYIGHSQLLGFPVLESLSLILRVNAALGDAAAVQWQAWDGAAWIDLTPLEVQEGDVPFDPDVPFGFVHPGYNEVRLGSMDAIPAHTVGVHENRWLRCCLQTPITSADEAQAGMVRASQLPDIEDIRVEARVDREGLLLSQAFSNQTVVDLSQDFFPFGERPQFGDTLYLAHREAFSASDATVTLDITLTNPSDGGNDLPLPATTTDGNPSLRWELWNGQAWIDLSTQGGFTDGTNALTRSGQVTFFLPADHAPTGTTVNSVEEVWLRVRLAGGHYGQEATYEQVGSGFEFRPATYAAPSIESITVAYRLTHNERPDVVLTYNDETFSPNLAAGLGDLSFTPFQPPQETRPTFYWGLTLPPDRTTFPNRPISFFSRVADMAFGQQLTPLSPNLSKKARDPETGADDIDHQFLVTNDTTDVIDIQLRIVGAQWLSLLTTPETLRLEPGEQQTVGLRVTIPTDTPEGAVDRGFLQLMQADDPLPVYSATFETVAADILPAEVQPRLMWEYANRDGWQPLTVRDETAACTRPGLIEFLPPADIAMRSAFGRDPQYWVRARWESGNYALEPLGQRLLLNTTMAAQAFTLQNEEIGSSDGSAYQTFQTIHTPVLVGQTLEVRERGVFDLDPTDSTSPEPAASQVNDAGAAATLPADRSPSVESWIPWQNVPDFYESGPHDRHYVLNHLTGEIRFSDGRNGAIPPPGSGNIRMRYYRSGGGTVGNRPAGAIVQMRTSIPYIDAVINHEPATGGADAEGLDLLRQRVPRQVRHRDRAVTLEDYEDLAREASPQVARARCVPLYNLLVNPIIDHETPQRAGTLSLIVIPHSEARAPSPGLELIRLVQDYLRRRRLATTELVIVGPQYEPVDVEVELAVTAPERASAVEGAVRQALDQFLHPLTGGIEGLGWDFGRQPHRSDLYALLEALDGVDHIRTLHVPKIDAGSLFLVYSGTHTIRLTF